MQVRRRKKEKVMKIAGIEKKGRKGRAREKGGKKRKYERKEWEVKN